DALRDEPRGEVGRTAVPELLPRAHERRRGPDVEHGRSRGRESEPTAAALAAALDGKGRRGTATRAPRRPHRPQGGGARVAERPPSPAAGRAALGQEEVVEPRLRRYGNRGDVSVPASCRNRKLSRASTPRAPAAPPWPAAGCRPRAAARGCRCRTRSRRNATRRPARGGATTRRTARVGRNRAPP